jgi:hypothetical protein
MNGLKVLNKKLNDDGTKRICSEEPSAQKRKEGMKYGIACTEN